MADDRVTDCCESFSRPTVLHLWMAGGWLALYIIRPWEVLCPSLGGWHLERIYVLTTMTIVAATGQLRFKGSFQDLGVLALFSAVLLSSLCGINAENTVESIWIYLIQLVFYFLVVSCVRTRNDILFMLLCYVGIMAATVGKAEYEYFVHDRHSYSGGAHIRRLIGINETFGHPNAFGPSAAISLVWAAAAWRLRAVVTGSWPTLCRQLYVLSLALYAALAVLAVVLTNSRTATLAAIFVVMLIAIHRKSFGEKVKAAGGAAVVLLVVWGLMPTEHRDRLRTIWDSTTGPEAAQATANARTEDFWFGVGLFKKHPLTGTGIDTTRSFRKDAGQRWETVSHNLYGKLLGETGVIGVGAFVLMILGVVVNIRKLRTSATQGAADVQVELVVSQAGVQMLLALLFIGWGGGAIERIEWMWIAAMCQVSTWSVEEKAILAIENRLDVGRIEEIIPQPCRACSGEYTSYWRHEQ